VKIVDEVDDLIKIKITRILNDDEVKKTLERITN
jgi:hypothetical protein